MTMTTTPNTLHFSVIIPAYNEARHLESFIKDLTTFFQNENVNAELICVNDGSKDETKDIILKLQTQNPKIKALNFEENQGQGYAFKEALKSAQGNFVFWLPSDGEIPPQELKTFLPLVSRQHIIVGFPTNAWDKRTLFRIFLSKSYQTLLRNFFGLRLHYFNAMAIFPREALQNISWHSRRFFFPAEILIRLSWEKKYIFQEVPFSLNQRSSGKSQALRWKVLNDIMVNAALLFWDKIKR